MIKGARKLPTQHVSIRVPWHDAGWDGTVCRNPRANTSCLVLPRIGEGKRDALEHPHAGKHLHVLAADQLPPCVGERVSFLSPAPLRREMRHPYSSFEAQYAHFRPTPFVQDPFSAACVPFRWMLHRAVVGAADEGDMGIANRLQLGFEPDREPGLKFKTAWVQQADNQLVLLDTFFGAIEPEASLCFFYAKHTPLAESPRRVLVGIGRVKRVGKHVEYLYEGKPKDELRSVLWERNVLHSIREDRTDGFVLPYQQLLALADEDPELRLEDLLVFVPDDLREQFSYGSEHVTHDGAIATLVACADGLRKIADRLPGPWAECLRWIDRELDRLWKARGPFPGLGSLLCAFGLEHGNLIGHAINAAQTMAKKEWREDPWKLVDAVFEDPSLLEAGVGKLIGKTFSTAWKKLPAERRRLLELLSRCEVSADQATRFWVAAARKERGIELTDRDLLGNLYRAFEEDRKSVDPVGFDVIDRGLQPAPIVAREFPVPKESALEDAVDPRRVRALAIDTLEKATEEGHTLLPRDWLIERVRARAVEPRCPLHEDILSVTEDQFAPLVRAVGEGPKERAFQLDRFAETRQVVSAAITKRLKGKRHAADHDWAALLDAVLPPLPKDASKLETERRARAEKAAALAEIFASRASVLIGPAGTGKTTLLRVLCDLPEVKNGGILLLAPTGKARVRLETQTQLQGQGKTIAQFLLRYSRYDGDTGRYFVKPDAPRCADYGTVIVDEASMLTEEQLAAMLDGLEKVARIVLVGDPRQLPPIGAGRPFVDVVRELTPAAVETVFPRCAPGYAELTVPCRHEPDRDDVLLARAFSGQPLDPGHDEVWQRILAGSAKGVSFVRWSDASEVLDKLAGALLAKLPREHGDEETRFECSLGGSVHEGYVYFRLGKGGEDGAAAMSSSWQVLSPLRGALAGVDALNRGLQQRFRKRALAFANPDKFWNRRIPPPLGPQGILWGDKVINVQNNGRRRVWPKKDDAYVANGDTGVVVGEFKTKKFPGLPSNLEVEFAGQNGFKYKYWSGELSGEDATPPLELAYALTVHKTQGSEFGTTYVVLPNPCRLLSRELLYTALTRHQNELVILHQGEIGDIRVYADESRSEIATRMTNLFRKPQPVPIPLQKGSRFLEDGLIHRTLSGGLVRSKSELYIADTLHRAGKRFVYEQPLKLADGGERYPDFTIDDAEAGVTFYWEHLGLLSDPGYRARWERKLALYRSSGIVPHDEGGGPNGTLIVTRDGENGGLDATVIDRIVREVLS